MSNIFTHSQLDIRSNPNQIINGCFTVNQRGAKTGDTASTWTVDRWFYNLSGATSSLIVDTETDGQKSLGFNSTVSNDNSTLQQRIENWGAFRDYFEMTGSSKVTVSFDYMEYSDNAVPLKVQLQYLNSKFSASYNVYELKEVPLSGHSDWRRVAVTFDLPMDTTQMVTGDLPQVRLAFGSVDDTSTAILHWKMKRVKLEFGSVATPFMADDPYTNLAKCQRYYWKDSATKGTVVYSLNTFGNLANNNRAQVKFPVTMRIIPKVTFSGWTESPNIDTSTNNVVSLFSTSAVYMKSNGWIEADAEI